MPMLWSHPSTSATCFTPRVVFGVWLAVSSVPFQGGESRRYGDSHSGFNSYLWSDFLFFPPPLLFVLLLLVFFFSFHPPIVTECEMASGVSSSALGGGLQSHRDNMGRVWSLPCIAGSFLCCVESAPPLQMLEFTSLKTWIKCWIRLKLSECQENKMI